MVYGYYIKDTAGNEHFFVEGCSYCPMSTGGQHGLNCPNKDIEVPDEAENYTDLEELVKWPVEQEM